MHLYGIKLFNANVCIEQPLYAWDDAEFIIYTICGFEGMIRGSYLGDDLHVLGPYTPELIHIREVIESAYTGYEFEVTASDYSLR